MIQFQQIENDLLKFIKYQALGGRPVSPTTDLLESDILDSLLLMDLVIHIESAYESMPTATRHDCFAGFRVGWRIGR